jgi:hypothetical protein
MRRIALFVTLVISIISCSPEKHPPVMHISLINGNRSVRFNGLDQAVMQEIARDSSANIWQSLVPVYRMPADTDLKNYQPVQPGIYKLKDSTLVFTPDTPFVKGQVYFVRNYLFGEGLSLKDYVRGVNKPGKLHFTDLIFKQ